jgi:hypothetical protein
MTTATTTLESLEKQGDQLRRVQGDVDEVGEMLERGDKHMRTIKSWTGAIANKFSVPTYGDILSLASCVCSSQSCWLAQKSKKYEHAAKMEEMTEEQKAKRAEEDFKKSRRQKSSGRTVLHHSGTVLAVDCVRA